MTPTTYQTPEIRDSNDNIIKQGSFGKNTALANSTNDGWIDYVANDLEFLYGLAKDEVVPVSELPSTGDTNKTYLLTTTGVCYRWDGTEWVEISSSEAVSRADSAAYLAEQWATKTSGTVDGTEYSAKYYAEQAQDTADDLSESLVQIATNTANIEENAENIAQNTTDIDIADKRISNVEKLLQGNLYDYQTDRNSKYVKTVPSGAMPYASLDSIGGKTVVWNQLVDPSRLVSRGTVSSVGLTQTTDGNGAIIINGTSTQATNIYVSNTLPLIGGHKYIVYCDKYSADWYFRIGSSDLDTSNGAKIASPLSSGNVPMYFYFASGVTFDNLSVRVQYTDLTLLYGAGNEPSTVEDFKAMFPADYYEYNSGELLSAGVTEVTSKGTNLLDGVTLVQSSLVPETGAEVSATDRVRTGFIDIKPNTEYMATVGGLNVENRAAYYYRTDKSFIRRDVLARTVVTMTSPQDAFYVRLLYRFLDESTIVPSDVVNPSLGKINTYPIPAKVQAIEGYGWSAGTVYNYIDFERKVLVKKVERIKIGNIAWQYNPTYRTFLIRENALTLPMKSQTTTRAANITCSKYVTTTSTNITSKDNIILADAAYLSIVDTSFNGNINDFKTNMGEGDIFYELATPIETDISAYLSDDNLIEVESGGTLTFPNANGDNYRIPVPSTEEYMINLQEAVSNG